MTHDTNLRFRLSTRTTSGIARTPSPWASLLSLATLWASPSTSLSSLAWVSPCWHWPSQLRLELKRAMTTMVMIATIGTTTTNSAMRRCATEARSYPHPCHEQTLWIKIYNSLWNYIIIWLINCVYVFTDSFMYVCTVCRLFVAASTVDSACHMPHYVYNYMQHLYADHICTVCDRRRCSFPLPRWSCICWALWNHMMTTLGINFKLYLGAHHRAGSMSSNKST